MLDYVEKFFFTFYQNFHSVCPGKKTDVTVKGIRQQNLFYPRDDHFFHEKNSSCLY